MSVQFTCPHCGATSEIADERARRAGHCVHCGKAIGVPLVSDVVPKWTGKGLSAGFLLVLFIIGCDTLGVLVSVLLPAVQAAREAARRAQCVNNLTQIGVAMQSYHHKHGCFPPAFIPDENGKPKHSWRVLILPFLEEHSLYAQYRFDEPWNGPHNMVLAEQMPAVYRCPSDDDDAVNRGKASYAMIVGAQAISDGPTARRVSDIKDGAARTVMLAEAANAGILWLEPRDLNTKDMTFCINPPPESLPGRESEIAGRHRGEAKALFCDGTVRSLEHGLIEKAVKALLTIDGGEAVEPR